MRAVAVCARQGLRLPDWLVDAFLTRFRAVAHLRVGSWDEAFGVPFPRGTQLAAKRRRFEARARVANVLTEFVQRHPELSVDDVYAAASAKVRDRGTGPVAEYAGRLGVGRTEAQRLYAEAINLGMAYPFDEIRKKNGWSARPAKSRKVAGVRRKP